MARTSGLASVYSMRPKVDMEFSRIWIIAVPGNVSKKRQSLPEKGWTELTLLLLMVATDGRGPNRKARVSALLNRNNNVLFWPFGSSSRALGSFLEVGNLHEMRCDF